MALFNSPPGGINWIIKKQFIIFSLNGLGAIRQYLLASESYLAAKRAGAKREAMAFAFPNVGLKCLLCGGVKRQPISDSSRKSDIQFSAVA